MSDTIVDMPKVTQMLDNGWTVYIGKNDLGSYTAQGRHDMLPVWLRAKEKCLAMLKEVGWTDEQAAELNESDFCDEGVIDTDDFTPEQALTRLAYKVHGEIL